MSIKAKLIDDATGSVLDEVAASTVETVAKAVNGKCDRVTQMVVFDREFEVKHGQTIALEASELMVTARGDFEIARTDVMKEKVIMSQKGAGK